MAENQTPQTPQPQATPVPAPQPIPEPTPVDASEVVVESVPTPVVADAPQVAVPVVTPQSTIPGTPEPLQSDPNVILEPEEEKKGKKKWILLILLLLAIIAGVIAAFVYFTTPAPQDNSLKPDPNVKVGALTDMGDLDKIVDEGMLTFSINASPSFESGDSEGNLLIENPSINNNRFTVTITRNDNKETVYQSGYLEPGQYIEMAKLNVSLPAGSYPCTAQFQTYKIGTDKAIGQAAAELVIYVAS